LNYLKIKLFLFLFFMKLRPLFRFGYLKIKIFLFLFFVASPSLSVYRGLKFSYSSARASTLPKFECWRLKFSYSSFLEASTLPSCIWN
jgi:hypothetical protein